jgi:hypothetical protein
MATWLSALLTAVPTLLRIIEQFIIWMNEQKLMDQGKREAIASAAQSLNSVLAKASDAAQQAAEKQAKDPTDDAFDPDFWRKG